MSKLKKINEEDDCRCGKRIKISERKRKFKPKHSKTIHKSRE